VAEATLQVWSTKTLPTGPGQRLSQGLRAGGRAPHLPCPHRTLVWLLEAWHWLLQLIDLIISSLAQKNTTEKCFPRAVVPAVGPRQKMCVFCSKERGICEVGHNLKNI